MYLQGPFILRLCISRPFCTKKYILLQILNNPIEAVQKSILILELLQIKLIKIEMFFGLHAILVYFIICTFMYDKMWWSE